MCLSRTLWVSCRQLIAICCSRMCANPFATSCASRSLESIKLPTLVNKLQSQTRPKPGLPCLTDQRIITVVPKTKNWGENTNKRMRIKCCFYFLFFGPGAKGACFGQLCSFESASDPQPCPLPLPLPHHTDKLGNFLFICKRQFKGHKESGSLALNFNLCFRIKMRFVFILVGYLCLVELRAVQIFYRW